jgi:hypothetical protein
MQPSHINSPGSFNKLLSVNQSIPNAKNQRQVLKDLALNIDVCDEEGVQKKRKEMQSLPM